MKEHSLADVAASRIVVASKRLGVTVANVSQDRMEILFVEDEVSDWRSAIRACGNRLLNGGFVENSFMEACIERELKYPTGLPTPIGIAIPHAEAVNVKKSCLCVLRPKRPVKFRRIDDPDKEIAASIVVSIAVASSDEQSSILSGLVSVFQDNEFLERLLTEDKDRVADMLRDRLSRNAS